MVERRGLLGGVCLIVGAVPFILFYWMHPIGYGGILLAGIGALVSYGAWQMENGS